VANYSAPNSANLTGSLRPDAGRSRPAVAAATKTAPRGGADPFLASVPRALGSDMAGCLFSGCGVVAIGLSSVCDRRGSEEPPKRSKPSDGPAQ
jgi:hypothetical protein